MQPLPLAPRDTPPADAAGAEHPHDAHVCPVGGNAAGADVARPSVEQAHDQHLRNEFASDYSVGLRQRLLSPLSLAAYLTWLAVAGQAIGLQPLLAGDAREWAGAVSMLAFLALFALRAAREPARETGAVRNVLLQGVLAVAAETLLRNGQVVILLIIVAGQLALMLPTWRAVACMLAFNAVVALSWVERTGSLAQALALVPVLGFQAFAGLTAHYAGASGRDRDRLAQVNAELLATQCLLEESARGGERLKLSRELHDVAGHKLTALKLNLARLMRDPALAGREEIHVSRQMADELLDDIRAVVSELRAHDGLDLRAALQALARPVAGTRIVVEVEDGLRVEDLPQAEALLRSAQEAITNALRHGHPGTIEVRCVRRGDWIDMQVRNDGLAPATLVAGNGLTGMRERVEALGGALEVTATRPHGVQVYVRLPAAHA